MVTQGYWKCMALFDSKHTISYRRFMVTISMILVVYMHNPSSDLE